ncbi:hypothetical protein CFOL_v3_12124 [Cephalotus follicularis]|uniref:Uncharacterized protein n=1 Tax=Cephalotus follicularis TaxID=3775 RepID=A0A1Q3BKT8_CEPFO|nr:hypothetical protein CFOL_v3_12124 [Cephalotus follicularis]
MVQNLEAIKGGGGSIKVGTSGTVSALMSKEMEYIKPALKSPGFSQDKARPIPVSVACGAATLSMLQSRKSLDEASSSGGSNKIDCRSTEIPKKSRSYTESTYRIPMLSSDNLASGRTPSRYKTNKKGSNIVEIVDIKCGKADRAWASPITNRLKKLNFSKLSESII